MTQQQQFAAMLYKAGRSEAGRITHFVFMGFTVQFDRIWNDHVMVLKGAYEMNP